MGSHMPYYVVSVLFFVTSSTFGAYTRFPRFFLVLGLLPMAMLALLRGDVGIDTAVYIQEIQKIISVGEYTHTFEPFFEALILLLSFFFDSPRAILATLGLFTTLFLICGKIDKYRSPFIFCAFLIPAYYFDMVMNGVRYGLSFSIVYFALPYLRDRKDLKFILWVLVAGLVQSSGGLLGIILYVLYSRRWKVLIACSALFSLVLLVTYKYFLAKLESYSGLYTTSLFSGASTLVVTAVSLFIWMLDPGTRKNTLPACLILLSLAVLMFGLAQYSYAGLRFLQLINFAVILFFIVSMSAGRVTLSKITKISLIGVAILAFVLKMKNFADSAGDGASPFVPYLFFWEEA
ncbi:hypothetical protein BOP93_07880 [Pseudomonas orientalis]|uniref:EpsG family protein n=2 Tax=Pseudomonas orientalis TaxID=76758 RepID=A0A2L0RTR5_9PSED|nr:hypothetical protein BOP93_07880 [Pseudomonas orientalis]